jgi:hypothetical protein
MAENEIGRDANVEEAGANNSKPDMDAPQKNGASSKLIDKIIAEMAKTFSSMVKSSDQKVVEKRIKDVLVTLFALSAQSEYSLGLRINGDAYRYSDYRIPTGLQDLVAPKRVVLTDVPTAIDFLKREMYLPSGNPLTPTEFQVAWAEVRSRLRLRDGGGDFSRSEVGTLQDLAKYAVNGGKVSDRHAKKLLFLNTKFDDEQAVGVQDWAKTFVIDFVNDSLS